VLTVTCIISCDRFCPYEDNFLYWQISRWDPSNPFTASNCERVSWSATCHASALSFLCSPRAPDCFAYFLAYLLCVCPLLIPLLDGCDKGVNYILHPATCILHHAFSILYLVICISCSWPQAPGAIVTPRYTASPTHATVEPRAMRWKSMVIRRHVHGAWIADGVSCHLGMK
jgi:hypothetical protein